MLCSKPYRVGVAEYGCGQCMRCRLNRRREWTGRLLLEASCHEFPSWFVTLTYDEEHLPQDGSLVPRHLQLFLKRLRARVHPVRVRFFGVGEYGDKSERPHYHLALFGLPDPSCIQDCWCLGFVHVGSLTRESAAYLCSYTLKKMTRPDDVRLGGRHVEFARMSLRPYGIGGAATAALAGAVVSRSGSRFVVEHGDVPGQIRSDGRKWPIGRYLRGRLRDAVGYDGGVARDAAYRQLAVDLRVPGARAARESKRLQDSLNGRAKSKISRSKARL